MSRRCSCGEDWLESDDAIDVGLIISAARRGNMDEALHQLEREIPTLADFCDALRKRLDESKERRR